MRENCLDLDDVDSLRETVRASIADGPGIFDPYAVDSMALVIAISCPDIPSKARHTLSLDHFSDYEVQGFRQQARAVLFHLTRQVFPNALMEV